MKRILTAILVCLFMCGVSAEETKFANDIDFDYENIEFEFFKPSECYYSDDNKSDECKFVLSENKINRIHLTRNRDVLIRTNYMR